MLLSVHVVQHMILTMVTPLFLALGAPVTLALRTLPARPRRLLLALLHTRLAKVLTFPPLALALFVVTPFVLYYSPLYELTLRSAFWHGLLHLHFVIVGSLLMWPLVGLDPVPGRIGYPFRLLVMFLMLPFHAILGISIMSAERLIAEDWYLAFERAWPPSPLDDQYLAGAIMWGSGDVTAVLMLGALFVQWFRHSQREARREDRRLDLADRRARYAQARTSPTQEIDPVTDESSQALTILLYASNRLTRENVRLALGRKVASDLPPVSVVEVATQPAVLTAMDEGGIDLAILDGEAVPGGMGLCRQLKDEIVRCPPILVLTGRPDDAWLATWSRADGVAPHPIDPFRLPAVVADLLRARVA